MPSIIFRTNAGQATGLGHLIRSINLARELTLRGVTILFVLDTIEPGIKPFLQGLECTYLYDAPHSTLDSLFDANSFIELISECSPEWVILDDYRLGESWETQVKQRGLSICVIDDLLRPHNCELLIDVRWRGESTQCSYDELVSESTRRLLGPEYALLSPAYQAAGAKKQGLPFTLMLGSGGAGALEQLASILDEILDCQSGLAESIRLLVVVGPLSSHAETFVARYQSQENVIFLTGLTELYPYLCQTNFYIGAAGSILYQLKALHIPALTFSLSESQRTELPLLEDIGHYFHIENWTPADIGRLPSFLGVLIRHRERIRALSDDPLISIDALGACRVSDVLCGQRYEAESPQKTTTEEVLEHLSDSHALRPVLDADINHYLTSRNLKGNRQNMIEDQEITRLDHYAWWFDARRESFLMNRDENPCLYIWHEIKHYQADDFLIGGWFICEENAAFQDALLALSWQLKYCDQTYPDTPWIAVIQRENRFVKLLSDYVGFQEVMPDHPYGTVIASIFQNADHDQFYFMTREATGLTAQKSG